MKQARQLGKEKAAWFQHVLYIEDTELCRDMIVSMYDANLQCLQESKRLVLTAIKDHFRVKEKERKLIFDDRLRSIEDKRATYFDKKWNAYYMAKTDEKLKSGLDYATLQYASNERH